MKIFDTLYYAIYRFGLSIRQPQIQAKACAVIFMPIFFVMVGFFLSVTLISKWDHTMVPHKGLKLWVEAITVFVWLISYMVYMKRGRGQRIISEYGKSEHQKWYLWLGAIFIVVTLSLPIGMYLVWRAVM